MNYEDRIDYVDEREVEDGGSLYDNEFYDDERDLDQQHPEFDF